MPTSAAERVLSTLAYLEDIVKLDEAPKDRVMKMAEITAATFPSMISRMKSKGLVAAGSAAGTYKITELGREQVPEGGHDLPTSNAEYHQTILNKLTGKPRAIFEILMDGKPHKKTDIMEAIDCTNPKTFSPLVSRELRKKNYVEFVGKDSMQLSDDCYPLPRDQE